MLAHKIEFAPERDAEIFAAVPASSAVFLLRGDSGEPFVTKSADLRRRLTRLLGPSEEGAKRLNLRNRCRSIEYTATGSDFESRLLLYQVLRAEFPKSYRERMKLRLSPLIKLNLENPFPRAYVTRRIAKLNSASRYYGPFPSRAAAEKFMNAALDFFKMRRCDFDLNPDPSFPGCIYSEMKMCLAPCFKGCTDEQYAAEVARVQQFFESSGQSLLREFEAERERASTDLQFESAAAIHARTEKVRGILGSVMLPEIVRPIDQLHAVIVQRSTQLGAVALFRVVAGSLNAPVMFTPESPVVASEQSAGKRLPPRSMESRIEELLNSSTAKPSHSVAELNEHLALLKRWYYRSRRDGEIFFTDESGELPLRRIVRGIGRVLKGEKPEAGDSEEAHRAYWLARTRVPSEPPA